MKGETFGICTPRSSGDYLAKPFKLMWGNRLAWEVWQQAVALSGYDFNGLPQITNLGLVLQMREINLKHGEGQELLDKIMLIQRVVKNHLQSRQPTQSSNDNKQPSRYD